MLFLLNSVLKQVCKDSKQQRSICRMHTFQLRHQWSALCNVDLSGVDPASNVRGVALSVKFGSQVSLQAYHCKRDEVYSTKLLWQNNGGQNGFMSWMLFSESHKIMMNKITFVGFRGGDRLNCPPPWIRPCSSYCGQSISLSHQTYLWLSEKFCINLSTLIQPLWPIARMINIMGYLQTETDRLGGSVAYVNRLFWLNLNYPNQYWCF